MDDPIAPMHTIKLKEYIGRSIHEHWSTGAHVLHLVSAGKISSIFRIRLEPDGVIGMHETAEDQLFLVIEGAGIVRSDESDSVRVSKGDAVHWRAGEMHETRTGPEGLTAIVIEGASLRDMLQMK